MKVRIVPIGNSKGIRIPIPLLKLCHIKDEVHLIVKGETIVIKPIKEKIRVGWDHAFKEMHKNTDDNLILDDAIDINLKNWSW
jgi:antitoxin MazE